MARTKDFAEVLRGEIASDPALAAAVEAESANADVATQVYQLRTEAKLTQRALAELVGTKQSVISRLENADYEGHSLDLLRRIATALGKKVRVEFYTPPTAPPLAEGTDRRSVRWTPKATWPVVPRNRATPVGSE